MTIIQRDALHAFIDRQLVRIETTPVPPELAELGACERFGPDEIAALWCGAGIASQIGLALMLDPGAFVDPWPDVDAEAALGALVQPPGDGGSSPAAA